jgi:amino acid transporter
VDSESPLNRWTAITIVVAIVCSLVAVAFSIYILRRPPGWWTLVIGAVIGVIVVQVIHKRQDPFA